MKFFACIISVLWLNGIAVYSQITGSGTLGYVAKFSGSTIISSSLIYDNGTSVGIGTTNPQSTLDISGTFHTTLNTQSLPLSYATGGLSINYNKSGGNGEVNLWNVYNGASSSFQFSQKTGATSSTDLMTIAANGNTGIGILPATKLDIQTTTVNDGINLRYNGTGFVRVAANSYGSGSYNPLTQLGDAGIIFGSTAGASSGTIGFIVAPWSNSLNGLRVDNNGNVGIATANTKGYQLAVNGGAIFTKAVVKAYNVWPDYVLSPAYNLPDLKTVESYLLKNRHLIDVPSAEDVEKNGIDLGNNQTILLKKVEELTLYIIALNKKIEALEKVNELKKMN